MMKTVTVLVAIVLLSGCGPRSGPRLSVDSASLEDVRRLEGKSKQAVVAAFGPPSRQHRARLGTYWEYAGRKQIIVFWSFDNECVLHANIGKDAKEAYAPWRSQSVPPAKPTMTTETAPSRKAADSNKE